MMARAAVMLFEFFDGRILWCLRLDVDTWFKPRVSPARLFGESRVPCCLETTDEAAGGGVSVKRAQMKLLNTYRKCKSENLHKSKNLN
jgi:hypothetical protein